MCRLFHLVEQQGPGIVPTHSHLSAIRNVKPASQCGKAQRVARPAQTPAKLWVIGPKFTKFFIKRGGVIGSVNACIHVAILQHTE